MARTAVVILNYNGVNFLEQFLPSVIAHSTSADVIVADNCSTDDSLKFLSENYPDLETIVLTENTGYAGGYNNALSQLSHDYFVLLNSDIEVTPNWIAPIIDFMDQRPEVAACQPKILDYNKKTHFEYAGAAGGFLDILGYPYCRGRVLDQLEKDEGQYDENLKIFWATGACFFIRRADFNAVNGFDESFFAHMEEIDLCWKLHHLNKEVYSVPSSIVYHVGGGTLNKINDRKTYLNFRNNLSLLFKNESWVNLIWIMPLKFLLDWAAGLKFWKDHSFSHFAAVLRAQKDFMLLISHNLKKRKEITLLKRKKRNNRLFLPYQYYVKGKKHFSQLHPHLK